MRPQTLINCDLNENPGGIQALISDSSVCDFLAVDLDDHGDSPNPPIRAELKQNLSDRSNLYSLEFYWSTLSQAIYRTVKVKQSLESITEQSPRAEYHNGDDH